MAGPGGKEVGRVGVRVSPNTSQFPEELRTELKRLEKTLKLQIPVELVTDEVKSELRKVKESTKREKIELDVEVDGDGAVRETRRIKNLAQKAVGAINLWANIDMAKTLATIKAQIKIIDKVVQAYRIRIPVDLVSWGRMLGYATAIAATLLTIPHILGAIGGAVSVVGGLLATLPALAVGAAVGITTLVVGMQGFFSALSQSGDAAAFEESLKNLTPSAQSAARALAEFREPLSEIRKSVQERLFEGMDESFRSLKSLLPEVKSGLTGAAGGIREMFQEWVKMATTQESQNDLTKIFFGITQGLKTMRPAMANVGEGLRDIAVVGSSFFIEWGSAVSDLTGKFRDWASEARKTGEMREWIENAVEKLKQMGRIIADIWVGFSNISNAIRGGREFLDIIEEMTQSFREWSEQSDVQATFKRIGEVLGQIVDVGSDVFGALFDGIGKVIKDAMPFIQAFITALGATLKAAIEIITPLLQGLFRFFSENKEVVVPLVIAIISLVTAFKLVATAAKGVIAIKDSIDAMRAAKNILSGVGKDFMRMAKSALKSSAQGLTAAARWVFAWTQIAAQAAVNAAKASAAWIRSAISSMMFTARYYAIMAAQAIAAFVRMSAAAVANAVKTSAAWVAAWVRMAVAALANAARMAAAWLIAMGPVGLIIAAVIALVALIIANWDSIVAATKAAWDFLWKIVSDVITAVVDFVKWGIDGIVDIFWNVVGWIGDALSGLWDAITAPFRAAFNWVRSQINSLLDAWDRLTNQLNTGFKGGSGWSGLNREDGGPVTGGKTYIANEAGTELYTKTSGEMFLMAGPMGEFTPPATGSVTSNRDIARTLMPLAAQASGSTNTDFTEFMERLLEVMGGWSIQWDPSGVAKMIRKENIKNKRRN